MRSPSGAALRQWITGMATVLAVALPHRARAQGCMPLKFLSPGMAGLQSSYLRPHEWQLGIAARRVTTNKFYAGSEEDLSFAPGGQPLYLHLNSLDLSATYAVTDRLSLTATVPFSYSTASNIFPDGNRHQVSSAGMGDVNLVGNFWVLDPGSHVGGNVVAGFGIKVQKSSAAIMRPMISGPRAGSPRSRCPRPSSRATAGGPCWPRPRGTGR
jgi:hypothetical protein